MSDRFREPVICRVPYEQLEPGPKGRLVQRTSRLRDAIIASRDTASLTRRGVHRLVYADRAVRALVCLRSA